MQRLLDKVALSQQEENQQQPCMPADSETTTTTTTTAAPSAAAAAPPPLADSTTTDYLRAHNVPSLIEHLSFAILQARPVDHVAFTRRWLANVREKLISERTTSIRSINLFAIDGNKIQRFPPPVATAAGALPLVLSSLPASPTAAVETGVTQQQQQQQQEPSQDVSAGNPSNTEKQDSPSFGSFTQPSLNQNAANDDHNVPSTPAMKKTNSGARNSRSSIIKLKNATRQLSNAKKEALEGIVRLAEKLHKDDVPMVTSFLQSVITRRIERQKREAEDSRMLRKYEAKHRETRVAADDNNNRTDNADDQQPAEGAAAAAVSPSFGGGGGGGGGDKNETSIPSANNSTTGVNNSNYVRPRGDNAEHAVYGFSSNSAYPASAAPRRRIAISATPVNVESAGNFSIREIDKSPEERQKLLSCIGECSLFTSFDDTQKELVVRAMVKEDFGAAVEILSQGQPSRETFYLVVSGIAEVIKDRRVVASVQAGQYFGELELMYNEAACAATIKTVTPVSTYGLGKETYQHIVLNAALERRALFLRQIQKVGIFETLKDYDKMRVAEALTTQQYMEGDVLIRCGEPVSWMFIVMDGTTRVVGRDPQGKPVNVIDLGVGHVIGELEFIFHHNAVADVVVLSTSCRVAKLNRKHFEMIVGEMTDEMKEYIASKDIYKHYMTHAGESVKKDIEGAQRRAARRKSRALAIPSSGGLGVGTDLVNIHPDGEVLFQYTNNSLSRFPVNALAFAGKLIIIAVVEDGTVQQWNDVVSKATHYKSDQAVGQSIFSFLTSEVEQSAFHQMLRAARDWMGNWEGYVESGLHRPRTFCFTQSDGLSKVQLSLTVVPAAFSEASTADVFLVVGMEVRQRPPSTSVDLGRWLQEKLQPRLSNLSKILGSSSHEVQELSGVPLRKARHGISSCERTLEQFVRIATANMEALQESWRPVSIHVFFQRLLSMISPAVRVNGNRVSVTVDEEFPAQDVFLDIEQMINALSLLIDDANAHLRGANIIVHAEVVHIESAVKEQQQQEMHSVASMHGWHSVSMDVNETINSQATLGGTNGSLASSPLGVVDGPKLLRITVGDTGVVCGSTTTMAVTPTSSRALTSAIVSPSAGVMSPGGADDDEGVLSEINTRGSHLADVRCHLASMGGVVTLLPSTPIEGTQYIVEVPLALAEANRKDGGGGAGSGGASENDHAHSFTTVLVERSAVQRNNVCQVLWSRRHAVLPVTTWSEVTKLCAAGTCDILLIDPECLKDDAAFQNQDGDDPFRILRSMPHKIAIIVTSVEMTEGGSSDGRSSSSLVGGGGTDADGGAPHPSSSPSAVEPSGMSSSAVMQLPKPWQMRVLLDTFAKAERFVIQYREDEERIVALRNTFNETKRGNCEMVRLLGRGAFGEVYEVRDELTGGRMAMKIMRMKNEADVDVLVDEIRTMTQLQHENIIHYFFCEKSSNSELKIFMELASGGTLQDKIKKTPGGCGLSDAEIIRHLQDLLNGIEYIHGHGYVHCDIKTANALLDGKERTKLGDFGTARKLIGGKKLYIMNGTPAYMAPEVMSADEKEKVGYDFKADIWSLGCVVLEMATGQPPFFHIEGTQGMGIFRYVSELTETPDLSPLFHCSPLLFQFVKACLEPNPERRPSAEELQKFSLLTQGGADTTQQAEKLVKRAQLLHILTKYVAFQDDEPDDGYRNGCSTTSVSREDGTSYGEDTEEGDSHSRGGGDADIRLDKMAKQGGFFSDDEDSEDEDEESDDASRGKGRNDDDGERRGTNPFNSNAGGSDALDLDSD